MAGDSRSFEKIWPEAEVYVDAFSEKFDELVVAWVAEGMDLHDAQDEAQHYARDVARDALKEFEAGYE
jgi:hypothetical protein